MPTCASVVGTALDVEPLREMLRPANGSLTITGSGYFTASHTLINLHDLQMQCGEEGLSRIWEGAISPERHAVSFLALPGPSMFSNGAEIGPNDIALHNSTGPALCHRLSGPTKWSAMSLPLGSWAEIGAALAGHDPTPPPYVLKDTPPQPALAKLRRLHASAVHLATQAPEVIANPDAARGLESALIQAMIDCLDAPYTQRSAAAVRHHTAILRRFRQALEESEGDPIYLPDLCASIGVSERTLRFCCHEVFGVGPRRYLFLRRMNLVRSTLKKATPDVDSVTDIAMRFGFWELGRFAVRYKSLFGEAPSATLRRNPL